VHGLVLRHDSRVCHIGGLRQAVPCTFGGAGGSPFVRLLFLGDEAGVVYLESAELVLLGNYESAPRPLPDDCAAVLEYLVPADDDPAGAKVLVCDLQPVVRGASPSVSTDVWATLPIYRPLPSLAWGMDCLELVPYLGALSAEETLDIPCILNLP
jgi:hypothetical protein